MCACGKIWEIKTLIDAAPTTLGEAREMLFLKYEAIVRENKECFSSEIYSKFHGWLAANHSPSLAHYARYQALFGDSDPRREFLGLYHSKFQPDVDSASRLKKVPGDCVKELKVKSAKLEANLEKYFLSFLMMGFMTSAQSSEFFFNFMVNEFVLEVWRKSPDVLLGILDKVVNVLGNKINPTDNQKNALISTHNLLKLYANATQGGRQLDVLDVKPYLNSTMVSTRMGFEIPPGVVRGPEVLVGFALSLDAKQSLTKKTLDYFATLPGFRKSYLQPMYSALQKSAKMPPPEKLGSFADLPMSFDLDPAVVRIKPSEDQMQSSQGPYWIVSRAHDQVQYEKEYTAQSQSMNAALEDYIIALLMKGYATSMGGRFLAEFVNDGYVAGAWDKKPEIVLGALQKVVAMVGANIDYSRGALADHNAMIVLNNLLQRILKLNDSKPRLPMVELSTYLNSLFVGTEPAQGVMLGVDLFGHFMKRTRSDAKLDPNLILYFNSK